MKCTELIDPAGSLVWFDLRLSVRVFPDRRFAGLTPASLAAAASRP
jgi:hypothetical protein